MLDLQPRLVFSPYMAIYDIVVPKYSPIDINMI